MRFMLPLAETFLLHRIQSHIFSIIAEFNPTPILTYGEDSCFNLIQTLQPRDRPTRDSDMLDITNTTQLTHGIMKINIC